MSEKLLPCPRCAENGKIGIESHAITIPDYRICCVKCGEEFTKWYRTENEAIEAWNKRHE